MGDLSKHFDRNEFACKCGCGQDTVDGELLTMLEVLREWSEKPIIINSGNRCEAYNEQIGGSTNSQHILSRAADIRILNVPPHEVQTAFKGFWPDKYGMGVYSDFTHVDSRKGKARWTE